MSPGVIAVSSPPKWSITGQYSARATVQTLKRDRRHIATAFNFLDLAAGFIFDRLVDKAHEINVFDFGSGPQCIPRVAHRDIHVTAHAALFHVAVTGAEVAQNCPHLAHKQPGFLGGPQVGFGNNLHQRHPSQSRRALLS